MMVKNHFEIFSRIIDDIDDKYILKWRYKESSFIRTRKLPPTVLTLQIFANKGRTTKMELDDFYRSYKMNGDVSVWGYEKRRLEFNPLMIHEMNADFLKEIYAEPKSLQKLNGYLILAVDGSDIKLPSTKKNYEKYGREIRKTVSADNEPCLASISCIYDCLNKYILDCQINRYKFSERASASMNIDNAEQITSDNAIYVFDRGYVSFDLMLKLINKKFVFRLQKRHFLQEQMQMTSDDQIFKDVYSHCNRKGRYTVNSENYNNLISTPIDLRFVRVHLNNGSTEYLVTNLSNEEFSAEAIGEIYKLRWNIESSYRTMKSQMKLEEFSGYLSDIIEQDIFSCVFMYNLVISNINDNYMQKEETRYKHKMKVNMNYSIGITKTLFIKILLAKTQEEKQRYMNELRLGINKYCTPIRENRSYMRKRNVKNKCSMSYKYSY